MHLSDNRLKKAGQAVIDFAQSFLIAGFAYFVIFHFLLQPTQVIGASMDPTLYDGERVITDILTYRFRNPLRGDIITFKYPQDPSQYFVKRIIGLPGEEILIKDGGVFIFNQEHPRGMQINEPYLSKNLYTSGGSIIAENKKIKIPSDSYVVMGDNRTNSSDSRAWGMVLEEDIMSRAVFCYWPPSKFGILR